MEKADEFSDKPYGENMLINSVNDVTTVVKNRTCENKQPTSETSNLESASLSCDTFSENADSKANTSHMNKFNDSSGLECRDEPNMLSSSVIQNTAPSASADSLLAQGCETVVPLPNASKSMDFKFNVEGSQYHSSRLSKNSNNPIRRVHPGSLSSEFSSHHMGLIENPSSGDADNDARLRNVGSTLSDAPCGKFHADNLTSKNLIESCTHPRAELPACAGDHLGCDAEKNSHSSDEYENSMVSVGNQKEIVTLCQKNEVRTSIDGGNLPEEHSKPPEQGLEVEKVGNIPATLNVRETSLQSRPMDDSDESDIVEHDVKVCDICGDAGREDLLAICCRCIDGAEHTYCMREMIDEVPEGDWLCEECKLDEENKITNQQKDGTQAGAVKDQSSGQADTEPASTFVKPDAKDSAVEEPRTSKDHSFVKVSGKRRAEESECSSAVKKQALEMITGSPRTSAPSRLNALTDSSIKDVDSGKLKSSHQFSSVSSFGTDSTEAARPPGTRPQLQSLRGAFFKSNSFNFPNARPKTKLVDEIVLQRQKSTKEPASHDTIGVREIGKSMSFRSTNSGRFGASGSKVKMLSPKSSHLQDHKNLQSRKERKFERSNSVKSPSVGNSSSSTALTQKVDKLLVSRGETTPFPSPCNHEVKPLKVDGKMIAGQRSTSRATNMSAEVPVSLGAINKQLPSSPPGVGTASSSGIISSIEQKSVSPKDESSSKLAISKESTNLADGIKESTTTSHLGPDLIPGTSGVSCQKYKQTGLSTQICTTDKPGSCGLNSSAVRSSKEVKNRDNKLKDAIEAALLKKPGIYRKNRTSDQSDESSVSSMNNEVAFVDRIPNSSNVGNLTSAEVSTDWKGETSRNSNANYGKESNGNNFKQSMMIPAEGITSSFDDSCSLVSSEGKHPLTELSSLNAVALSSLLKIPAIPDHECIWQGSFEISRSGKNVEFWDGLQAHISTCASPRVFEAVNKLPHKILLNGVSRISAWPVQFEYGGAKEDNIALYFFAKDVESYEKSYQVLLEDMMRGDLALIGSIDGVELLIFPSNQLPEKSHRWNMLFFLWGVFRGKKNSLHQVPGSPEKFCFPQVASSISTNKMPLPKDACLQGSIDKDRHVDSEFKGNLNSRTTLQERAIDSIAGPADGVNVVPASSGEILSFSTVTDGNISVQNKSDSKDVVKCSRNPKFKQGSFVTVVAEVVNHPQIEPRNRAFVDLSEDDGFTSTSQANMWHEASSQMAEEGNVSKKQKSGLYGSRNIFNTGGSLKEKDCELEETGAGNSNGERHFFPLDPRDPPCEVKDVHLGETFIPLIGSSFSDRGRTPNLELALGGDLNEDISCIVGDNGKRMMTKKEEEDISSSLSLSLSFSHADKDKEDRENCRSTPSMLFFRDIMDK